jgi:aspartate aminotransferase
LFEGLSQIPGLFVRKPEGAFYFVARLPVEDGEDFARFLLSEFQWNGATVMVAPAEGFYATPGLGRNEVRIAYVLNQEDLRVAVRVLEAGLAEYRRVRGLPAVAAEVASPARG